nr:immunoglobulin light chain junction region [Macaca mulatta]MOW09117.1 immunoglobulin light chain junction region [Macaca mulatta]MOW09189.1 immunoglobulin light chain junction region [Macaca mulatta]MOW09376.1 immunoglobulin light chain junction region [Macaca mulatta]MOW10296.1 immunoglobulin light chain junction region [Macaca mulatta]
CQQGYNAPLAF